MFIHLVDDASAGGGTSIYDALDEGVNSLLEFRKKHPSTILRIIALTDGEDNSSKIKPEEIARRIVANRIILDSFVVSHDSVGLKTITHASGGRCYCPEDLISGMKLFEIETILSVAARDMPLNNSKMEVKDVKIDLEAIKNKPFDTEGL